MSSVALAFLGAAQVSAHAASPVVTGVTITSSNPKIFTNSTLTATPAATDSDGDSLTFTYQWIKNGSDLVGETASTLNLATAGNGDKGDQISVRVVANDGTTNSAPFTSAAVVVVNSGPTVTGVNITPTNPTTNVILTAHGSGTDPDGDTLKFLYIWMKNGVELPNEKSQTLDLSKPGNGDVGDVLTVLVKAQDGSATSAPLTSSGVTVVVAPNNVPVISSVTITPPNPTTTTLLTAVPSAMDADNDPLTFTYQWIKNGSDLVGETASTLDLATAGNGDRGDQISVRVVANDLQDSSAPFTSSTTTIINAGPTVSNATITPANPTTNSLLTINATASDPDGDSTFFAYVWMKNGIEIQGEITNTLNLATAGNGDKGDVITAIVKAKDGSASSAPFYPASVTIANTAPMLGSVTIAPISPTTNSLLTATVSATDADGDAVQNSYQWAKNGTDIVGATGATLDLSVAGNGDKGDSITVRVVATDGSSSSAPVTSSPVVVANSAPVVSSVTITPTNPTTNSLLTATVSATDADGDATQNSYQWAKNGTDIVGATGSTLDLSVAGNGDKGDVITVAAFAADGTVSSSTVISAGVIVGNTAPVLSSVTVAPTNPTTNSTLTATPAATDIDGDGIQFSYQWKKNGTNISGAIGNTLDLSVAGNGDHGDVITVEVFATDGTANSSTITSAGVTVGNTLPSISSVTLTPTAPITTDILTANVVTTDVDGDSPTYTYVWSKNGNVIAGETGPTLDLSVAGNGDDNDVITVTVTANDGTGDSAPVTSSSVTVLNFAPTVSAVTPVGATDMSGSARTFTVTVTDGNGPKDVKEIWLLANTRLNWGEGATFIYVPSASSPTDGLLYLRRGDSFLPPITVGTGSSASAILDNGAVRVVGNQVSVNVVGNAITLSIPAVVRDGLIGANTLYARVIDRSGVTDPAALSGDMGFVSFGSYTVTPQFATGTNSAPIIGKLTPVTTNSSLMGASSSAVAQKFGFFVGDADGVGDIDSVWFLVNKQLNWTNSATIIYVPRTRRLYLRSDDGNSFIGGAQIGTTGILENSQVRIDLSQIKLTLLGDGKNLGLTLFLQAKTGLIGQNKVWIRVQDNSGATPTDGDAMGYVQKGTWNVVPGTAPAPSANTSNGNS
ncbi:hypothetical protein EON83_19520 [bacterium]|nr:MAG: hypothetical protein EON83_19520 [bacterium]